MNTNDEIIDTSASPRPEKQKKHVIRRLVGYIRRPKSLRMRIFFYFTVVLVVLVLLMFVAFQLIVANYVRNQALSKLSASVTAISGSFAGGDYMYIPGGMPFEFSNDAQRLHYGVTQNLMANTKTSDVQTLIIDYNYDLIYPTQSDQYVIVSQTLLDQLMNALQNNIGRKSTYFALNASGRHYYATLYDMSQTYGLNNTILVFYVDTVQYESLMHSMVMILLFVVLVTVLLMTVAVLLLSRSISRPLGRLTRLAEQIGVGEFKGTDLQLHDAELVELNHSLNETAEKLEKYDRDQKTFFQNASHELRTPLMSIKGYAEGLEYGVFDNTADAARVIVNESDRLTQLVEDLLYISRLDTISSADTQLLQNINMKTLVSDSIEEVAALAAREGREIVFTDNADVMIAGNEKGLRRGIVNILSNALRYSRKTVTVELMLYNTIPDALPPNAGSANIHELRGYNGQRDAFIYLTIADDGPGISASDTEHLFKRFYKGQDGKHGIGLSITKAVVEQHGGIVFAVNGPNGGAMFVIILRNDKS